MSTWKTEHLDIKLSKIIVFKRKLWARNNSVLGIRIIYKHLIMTYVSVVHIFYCKSIKLEFTIIIIICHTNWCRWYRLERTPCKVKLYSLLYWCFFFNFEKPLIDSILLLENSIFKAETWNASSSRKLTVFPVKLKTSLLPEKACVLMLSKWLLMRSRLLTSVYTPALAISPMKQSSTVNLSDCNFNPRLGISLSRHVVIKSLAQRLVLPQF